MSNAPLLIRYFHPDKDERVGLWIEDTVYDVTHLFPFISTWLHTSVGRVDEAIESLIAAAYESPHSFLATALDTEPSPNEVHWLPPMDEQEIWASGVTYKQSREARQEEAEDGGDVYARVYDAERPELFMKASSKNTVGHLDAVGIRKDSKWNVPEPELGLVLNSAMEMVGFTIGNDMSSRDIEGANPLYLPQAKVYSASCGLGPGILLAPSNEWLDTMIHITIARDGADVFSGSISTSQIKRTLPELVGYLGRSNSFPNGVILLTGTGVVPDADFTLAVDDVVTITIDGIGTLQNRVKEV